MRFLQIGSQNWIDTIEIQQEEDQNQWFFIHDTITSLQEFEMATLEMRQIQDNDKINKNPNVEIRPTHLSVEKFIGEINAILIENPNSTSAELSEQIEVTTRTIERAFNSLQEKNIIKRIGSKRDGYWIIVKQK